MLMLNQMVGFGVRSQPKYLIKVWAPGGGSGNWFGGYNSGVGGSGSYVEAEFAKSFLTGQTLIIHPGQGGFRGPTGGAGTASGVPYQNGGESRTQPDAVSGGAGGGLCGVFLGSVSFANALIIAGSGGGAGGFGDGAGWPGGRAPTIWTPPSARRCSSRTIRATSSLREGRRGDRRQGARGLCAMGRQEAGEVVLGNW